ncbi:uncharacterized protein LOC103171780 [Callorhinchus milii]|uniref:uncharacterized protein LOC103171780 n=1 Tax=Callorhinchus milii TaxID=7868 RepID=UPI001C3FD6A7|nr:uncharacterized protein LOC103171780 [Callorhinchus milii]XP_042201401.1 uncharacterized protein LOC103171780 [Callorhinchus milii]XP_042201402.1 uncharacterized protein LOC103171780 [Callorhinchus milii]XP_042201403.1 uncharacterized protein LOC103171780 [Callorhinchus milii]
MGNEGNITVEMACLGRPFRLGMLYDCRSDSLIPGITLWDLETLNASVRPQPNTQFQIIASDSIEDKSSALNVTGELKASLLGGMIQLQGSAKYLNDTRKSQHQARVTLQYSTTTRFEQLSMKYLGEQNISDRKVFDQGTATHVVTAVLFGAQAFFVFDREISSSESLTDVQRHMEAKICNIPKIGIDGEVSLKMSEEAKVNDKKFSFTFYGDYALSFIPTTFVDAIDIYTSLPQRLGENGEHAVPMKVWLYPLNKLDFMAAQLVCGISVNLVSRSQALLEALNEVDMRCNDIMTEFARIPFPEIKQKLQRFRARCAEHRLGFQKRLASILPSIRGGEKEEGILADILNDNGQSPLESQSLTEWLNNMHQEMFVVRNYLTKMKDIKCVTQNELDTEVLDPMIEHVVCFTFTSLHQEDLHLSEIDNYLQSQSLGKAYLPIPANPGQEPWFRSSHSMRECARIFLGFYTANRADESTKYVVASVPDKDHPGASIYLYEDGTLLSRCFKPPSKPPTPSVCGRSHDSVSLNLNPADPNAGLTVEYRVEYRTAPQEGWSILTTQEQTEATIPCLSPYKMYQFQYRAVSKEKLQRFRADSQVSDTVSVSTLPTSAPGKPSIVQKEAFGVQLTWDKPDVVGDGVTVQYYKIQYQESRKTSNAECDQWQEIRTKDSECLYILAGLKPSTSYILRVSAVCAQAGESAPSFETSLTTKDIPKSPSRSFLNESKLLKNGSPSIYELQRVRVENQGDFEKYSCGKGLFTRNIKSIMVLGATGSGKTTLINAMANYILGVEWEDDFRFKLIHEETNRSQAESQTASITAYELNNQEGFRIPYPLIIIDTPGFGDTRGIARDREIIEKIRNFFTSPQGVDQIDAICFVVQASLARLTTTQKYIFDSILSLFGKDIAENIRVLVTFADGQLPPVLEAIKQSEIPCPKGEEDQPLHFKFNNSAIFAQTGTSVNNVNTRNFDKMFWEMGTASMEHFFNALHKMPTKSLLLTKEVLDERKQLDVTVEGLQPQINVGLSKLEEIRKTQHILQQHEAEVAANQNFEYDFEYTVQEKIDISGTGTFITNCCHCNFTCHYPCCIPNDGHKHRCAAMKSGNCTVCPNHCHWSAHFNQTYKFNYIKKTEKRTFAELKDKYEKASGEKMTQEKLMMKLEEELLLIEVTVLKLVETLSHCLERLKEIALRPNPLSTPEYIDLLIEAEKQERKPGYMERIESLNQVKNQAQICVKVSNKVDLLPEEFNIHIRQQQMQQENKKGKKGWFSWLNK